MQRTSFAEMPCPVARALERVGDWWTILILREAFYGSTRFDEFQRVLGIAPNILTKRLKQLCDDGLLEARLYSEKPPRHEYHLTECGRDFRPVMLALMTWGNKHFAPEGPALLLLNRQTGKPLVPVMVDANDHTPIDQLDMEYAAGPAASESLRRHLSKVTLRLAEQAKNKAVGQ
jgi:DNA-binding HxlR family transcriptional regulator